MVGPDRSTAASVAPTPPGGALTPAGSGAALGPVLDPAQGHDLGPSPSVRVPLFEGCA